MTPNPSNADRSVGLNEFARRRHTESSRYSYFAGTEEELTSTAQLCLPHARAGNRDGILHVPMPTAKFFSGIVQVNDRSPLAANWVRRAEGEDVYIEFTSPGSKKSKAVAVELIVYRRDLLEAGGKPVSGKAWDIISINARDVKGDEPPHPIAMARNYLRRPGGTWIAYTVRQFVDSILYWSNRAHVGGDATLVTGPEYPPIKSGFVKSGADEPWGMIAWCDDDTFLPKATGPKPQFPVTLATHWRGMGDNSLLNPVPDANGFTAEAEELANSIWYWGRRPRLMPSRK